MINELDEDAAADVLAYACWLLSAERSLSPAARLAACRELLDERPRA